LTRLLDETETIVNTIARSIDHANNRVSMNSREDKKVTSPVEA
jgi:hypothetical protein